MNIKQICQFPPKIDVEAAQAFLDSKYSYSGVTPEQLVRKARSLIRRNRIGLWIYYSAAFLLSVELPVFTGWICTLLYTKTYTSSLAIIVWFATMIGTGIALGVAITLRDECYGPVERAFLFQMFYLQKAYGDANLDFSCWKNVSEQVRVELMDRAERVLDLRDKKGTVHQDTTYARIRLKELLWSCVNFKDLASDGLEDEPYYRLVEAFREKK